MIKKYCIFIAFTVLLLKSYGQEDCVFNTSDSTHSVDAINFLNDSSIHYKFKHKTFKVKYFEEYDNIKSETRVINYWYDKNQGVVSLSNPLDSTDSKGLIFIRPKKRQSRVFYLQSDTIRIGQTTISDLSNLELQKSALGYEVSEILLKELFAKEKCTIRIYKDCYNLLFIERQNKSICAGIWLN